MKTLTLTGALLLLGLLVFFKTGWAGEENVQEKAVASWRARESGCTSFKIKWKETQTFVEGSLTNPKARKRVALPPKTTEVDASFMLCADGEKMKEISDAMEITEKQEMKRQSETTVFNGEVNKSFRPTQIHDYPQGFIGDEKYLPGLNVYNLRPVLVPFRPFRYQKWGYFTETDLLNNYANVASASIGEHKCTVLRDTRSSHSIYEELWLDPDRGYIPLREVVFSRGKAILQIDWDEYKREGTIWVPVGWKIQQLSGGVKKTLLGKVLEFSVNQPIPPEEFEIDFPPGTWVIDRRSRDDHGKPSYYIVKSSGKRMISREELTTKTYQELNQEQGFKLRWRLVLVLSAVALVAIALVYYRRKKHVLH